MAKATQSATEIKRGGAGAMGAVNAARPARASRSADIIVRRGVGIKSSTLEAIEGIAQAENLTVNSVMRFGLEYFIEQYHAGAAKAALRKRIRSRNSIT